MLDLNQLFRQKKHFSQGFQLCGSFSRNINLISSQDNTTFFIVQHFFFLSSSTTNLFHHIHRIAPKSKLYTLTMQLIYNPFLEENNSCKTLRIRYSSVVSLNLFYFLPFVIALCLFAYISL